MENLIRKYCGPPGAVIRDIMGRSNSDGAEAWFNSKTVYYVHKARTAIRHACDLLGLAKESEVLAPSYNCGSEIDALRSSGVSVTLYDIDRSCRTNLSDLRRRISEKTRAIYVTHYFGFPQLIYEIKKLCEDKDIYLIEDCALSLFSCDGPTKLGSIGDISVFNFPKVLPVPDGGALVINNADLPTNAWGLQRPNLSKVMRGMLPLLKRNILRNCFGTRVSYPFLWSVLKRTQMFSNGSVKNNRSLVPEMPRSYYYDGRLNNKAVSAITKRLLRAVDVSGVINRRRENFNELLSLLSGVEGIEPLFKVLPDGVCPLHFPVIVDSRREICQKMNGLCIATIEWWAGYHPDFPWDEYPSTCFLKNNLLTLPLHQQLDKEHITFIAQSLVDVIERVRGFK